MKTACVGGWGGGGGGDEHDEDTETQKFQNEVELSISEMTSYMHLQYIAYTKP